MGAAEVAGRLAVQRAGAGVADRPGQDDVGRQLALRAEHARDDAAGVRLDAVGVEVVAGHHPALAVLVRRAGLWCRLRISATLSIIRAMSGKCSQIWMPVHVGLDRLELAAHLGRGVGLHVPGVEVAGRADQEDRDAVLMLARRSSTAPAASQPQQVGQRHAGQARGARLAGSCAA